MRKIHLQAQISIVEVAEVAKAMWKKGLLSIKPSDVIRFSLRAAHSLLEVEPMSEIEAEEFLQRLGYTNQSQLSQSLISAAVKTKTSREELEDMIEQIRRGPSSSEEIKEMLGQSPILASGGKDDTHLSEVQEVGS